MSGNPSGRKHGKKLLLVGPTRPGGRAGPAQQVLDLWPPADRPVVTCSTLEEVLGEPDVLDRCALAWIVADTPRCQGLYDLVAHLQDRACAALLTQPGAGQVAGQPFMDGIMLGPPDAAPEVLVAMLRSLWCQAELVHAVKTELSLLRLHHGGVIDQFDKMDEEMRLAARLQRDLMPAPLTESDGLAFDVLFRPSGYVSGDIYDVTRLDDRTIGFFLADAVGHGVPAALMTIYLKSSLTVRQADARGPGGRRYLSPEETLARLNRDMIEHQSGPVMTATAVYGIIDTHTHVLELARAGHPYPLRLRADGTCESLAPEGAMLGVFPEEVYETLRIKLDPGDRVVLYSDGFELAFPVPPEPRASERPCIANDRYLQEFLDLAHGPLPDALARLATKLDLQIGSLNQRDDLTVVLIETLGRPAIVGDGTTPSAVQGRRA